ncbi:hypothetical protein BVX98_02245 [bacterium F11]|nr:hypothetical protein BVX98_02245 [bacterium F11]
MSNLALGLMSGTSADSISAALGSFKGHSFELLGLINDSMSPEIQKKIRMGGDLSARDVSELNVELGHLFAKAALHVLKKTHVPPSDVLCVGLAGQTIYHGPGDSRANTFQIGDPAVVVEKTGIPTVSHFREQDLAVGGQGAPLIPYFDQYFYGHGPVRAFLNIGGMSNVTIVGKGIEEPLAFDIGPGNWLMDNAMLIISDGKENHDHNGRLAKKGQMDMALISDMMEHPFFKMEPPKSTGAETFGSKFLETHFGKQFQKSPADILATLNYLTCISIQESFRSHVFNKFNIAEIIVSGGGVYNKTLLKKLECLFAPIPVLSIEKWDIPAQAKEPLAFGFFGLRAMQNKVNHLPACTGASRACVLGSITRP